MAMDTDSQKSGATEVVGKELQLSNVPMGISAKVSGRQLQLKYKSLFKTLSPCGFVDEPLVNGLYAYVTSTEAGEAWLYNLLADHETSHPTIGLSGPKIERKNVGTFKQSCLANANFCGLVFYLGFSVSQPVDIDGVDVFKQTFPHRCIEY